MKASAFGKIAYGSVFIILLPAVLFVWGGATNDIVTAPVFANDFLGFLAAATGGALMALGMGALIVLGKGLPMNAYPPALYVNTGIYKFLSHPIYVGCCACAIGISILLRSSSGLWLVSPTLILACVALVYGYERDDLRARFGNAISRPYVSLPSAAVTQATLPERISVYLLIFLPWFILYEAVIALGVPPDARTNALPFEQSFPVIEWTELIYASTYAFVLIVPLLPITSRRLRTFAISGLVLSAIGTFCFLTIPFIAPPRPFIPAGFFGRLLAFERSCDGATAAFPSTHVMWAMLAAHTWSQIFPKGKTIWWLVCAAISISCFTTGMHTVADVIGGWAAGILVLRIDTVWEAIRSSTERLANSWHEWRVGRMRIINHGGYVALGSFAGLCIVGSVVGTAALGPMLIVAFFSLLGAGMWAQIVEGSPSLLRPFGYYGGVLGAMAGCVVVAFMGADLWIFFAAFAIAAPWIQAAGRLRCLVQGCCHGREASAFVGIRYTHPRSRVCRLSTLTNVPVHPTPLYSILWNAASGILLMRLYSVAMPPPFIAGCYLILNGLGRFVEESYRGEPQTASFGNLRLYQWLSIGSLLLGIGFTIIPDPTPLPVPAFSANVFFASLFFGALTWCAMGVDFPQSDRRFSRLA
jgi:prolipoprotein diacylglyceryltransferase/protein-S-isoprenylcysteine O-methyltransferase Ste14